MMIKYLVKVMSVNASYFETRMWEIEDGWEPFCVTDGVAGQWLWLRKEA